MTGFFHLTTGTVSSSVAEGERGRKGGREGGRKGGREGGREGGRKGRREMGYNTGVIFHSHLSISGNKQTFSKNLVSIYMYIVHYFPFEVAKNPILFDL